MSEQHSRTNEPHPFQYEKGVFVSYAWGGESEEIVNQIEQALQTRGVKVIRDKRDLGYKGSIRQFMERIGRGNCVIVVISNEYLRSQHCMFELVEIAEAKQFHDRIFPVVLGDADIYEAVKRIEYVRYWEGKRAELAEAMGTVDPANLQGIREDMDLYDRIRDEIAGLTSTLKDMNTLTPEMHKRHDYTILADTIVERTLSNNQVQQKKILDRRLDAAMPTTAGSNELVETSNESQSDHNSSHSEPPQPRKELPVQMRVAIVTGLVTIIAALINAPWIAQILSPTASDTPTIIPMLSTNTSILNTPTYEAPTATPVPFVVIESFTVNENGMITTIKPNERANVKVGQNIVIKVKVSTNLALDDLVFNWSTCLAQNSIGGQKVTEVPYQSPSVAGPDCVRVKIKKGDVILNDSLIFINAQ